MLVAMDCPYSEMIFSGVAGALGFSSAENLQYLFQRGASPHQLLARLVTANIVHVGCTLLIVSLIQKFVSRKARILSIASGIVLHGFYDLCLLADFPTGGIGVIFFIIISNFAMFARHGAVTVKPIKSCV